MMPEALKRSIWPPVIQIFGVELTGWLLLSSISFSWPRSADEAMEISEDQYQMLMQGLEIIARHPISEIDHPRFLM